MSRSFYRSEQIPSTKVWAWLHYYHHQIAHLPTVLTKWHIIFNQQTPIASAEWTFQLTSFFVYFQILQGSEILTGLRCRIIPAHWKSTHSAAHMTTYIGRMGRQLFQKIRDHHPRWIKHNGTEKIRTGIMEHLVGIATGTVDIKWPSQIAYRVPPNPNKQIYLHLPTTAKANANRTSGSIPWVQRRLFMSYN